MSPSATNGTAGLKPNVGVYTNPKHSLWLAEAGPSVESVQTGADLKEGEVTIAIRSTGICGCVRTSPSLDCLEQDH